MKRLVSLIGIVALTIAAACPFVESSALARVAPDQGRKTAAAAPAEPVVVPGPRHMRRATGRARPPRKIGTVVPGRMIVGFEKPVSAGVAAVGGERVLERAKSGTFAVVAVPADRGAAAATARTLSLEPNVTFVVPVRVVARALVTHVPDDPDYRDQWWMHDVGATFAWPVTQGSASIAVAVVDTGVNYNHPDLTGHMSAGYDWVNDDSVPLDDMGHGTHVAGIVGASANNGVGIAGVAPGCAIIPEKVLAADGFGENEDIALGIDDAVFRGADVINASIGEMLVTDPAIEQAVSDAQAADVVFVAAAGNEKTGEPSYPAQYAGVVAVSATTRFHGLAEFSNFGSPVEGTTIDLAAPGVDVLSLDYLGGTTYMSGTSMAAPVVAGTMALVRSQHPAWTAAQVIAQVESSAMTGYNVGVVPNDRFGYGIVDPPTALGAAPYAADAFEPDNGTGQAGPISFDSWTEHSFDDPYSPDVASFPQETGHRYIAQTEFLMFTGTRLDRLSSTGAVLQSNQQRTVSDPESQLTWTAPGPSAGYVAVNDKDLAPSSRYAVRVMDKGTAIVPEAPAGIDRYATAVQASKAAFPGGSGNVIIATGNNYADALGAGALAGAWNAPILLVPSTGTIPSTVLREIERLHAYRAFILGGAGAVNAWVQTQVQGSLTGSKTINRYPGVDRYETASKVAVAAWTKWKATRPDPRRAFIVIGTNYGDALLAGPLAYKTGSPILLTPPGGLSSKAAGALRTMRCTQVVLVGGHDRMMRYPEDDWPEVARHIEAQCPLVGDYWDISEPTFARTGVILGNFAALRYDMHWDGFGVATASSAWDALGASPLLGSHGAFLMMTPPSVLDSWVDERLREKAEDIDSVRFFGGTGAVSQNVRNRVMDILQ